MKTVIALLAVALTLAGCVGDTNQPALSSAQASAIANIGVRLYEAYTADDYANTYAAISVSPDGPAKTAAMLKLAKAKTRQDLLDAALEAGVSVLLTPAPTTQPTNPAAN